MTYEEMLAGGFDALVGRDEEIGLLIETLGAE